MSSINLKKKVGRKRKNLKKKKDFSKLVVSYLLITNIIFTIAVFYAFVKTNGSEPVALITAWFGHNTAEMVNLMLIKKKKVEFNYSEIGGEKDD